MPVSLHCCHSALAGPPVGVSVRPVWWTGGACRDGAGHAELAECGRIYSYREEEMGMAEICLPR